MLIEKTPTELAVIAQAEITRLENEVTRLRAEIHDNGNAVQGLIAEEVREGQIRTAERCVLIMLKARSRTDAIKTVKARFAPEGPTE